MACANRLTRRIACGALLPLLVACTPPTGENQQAEAPSPTAQTLPAPPPPLGRAELLAAVSAATASLAAGEAYPAAASALSGRRFSLRLPFGCNGPSPPDAKVRYRYDPDRNALQLSATPEVWTDTAWAKALAGGEKVEAIEGFWVRRPWMLTENCPAAPPPIEAGADVTAAAEPTPETKSGAKVKGRPDADKEAAQPVRLAAPAPLPSPETLALARVFEVGGSRLMRRGGRPYEVTRRLEASEAPGPQGYRLVLQGRVSGAPDPVRCRSNSPDQRPVCLVLVEFDRVAFEDPAGKTLAEWRS